MSVAVTVAAVIAPIALTLGGCGAHHRRVEGPPPEYEVPDDGDAGVGAANADGAPAGVVDSGASEPPAAR